MYNYDPPKITDNRVDLSGIVYYIYMNISEASLTNVYFCTDGTVHIDAVYGGNDDFVVIDKDGLVIEDNSFFHDFMQGMMRNRTAVDCNVDKFIRWSLNYNVLFRIDERGFLASF